MTSIKPFFHLKNYKEGISDALLDKSMDATPRSPEYKQGYAFGRSFSRAEPLTDGEVLDLVYEWVEKNIETTGVLELKMLLKNHEYGVAE